MTDTKERASRLFSSQIAKLKSFGVESEVLGQLRAQRSTVLENVSDTPRSRYRLSLLPVISVGLVNHDNKLIQKIIVRGERCQAGYELIPIHDAVEVPPTPYYVYDVKVDESTLGLTPKEANIEISRQERKPITFAELVAFLLHSKALFFINGIWALGSTVEEGNKDTLVPFISMNYGTIPAVGYMQDWAGIPDFGSASCTHRSWP